MLLLTFLSGNSWNITLNNEKKTFSLQRILKSVIMKQKLLLLLSLFVLINVGYAQKDNVAYLDLNVGKSQSEDMVFSLKGIYSHPYNEYFSLGGGVGLMGVNRILSGTWNLPEFVMDEVLKDYSIEIPLFVNFRGRVPIGKSPVVPYYSFSFGYMFSLKSAMSEFAFKEVGWDNEYMVLRVNESSKGLFYAPEVGVSIGKVYVGVEYMFGLNDYHEVNIEHYHNNFSSEEYNSKDSTMNVISLKLICVL